ncbi:hypothetical protein PC113_g19834 [Phytophthora cactorum]|uniref:Uncharacterized protein n=1 Tax=Phytophthora cactorum TaxID=29920 RepID=A0A8T0Y564_9STRA|nr:hypothetical protein PC113_g19834 [Phytophthora cactorum]KAG2880940.1 hypothetical protein PC114_g21821 [Phytophthora cactorum]KAG3058954.1 hypothetical protein PC122_g20496 [Phytophthora cactorum]
MQYSVSAGRLAGVKAACTDLFMSTHLATRDGFNLVSATFCFLTALIVNAISAFTVDKGNVGNILSSFSARLQTLWYKYMY